MGGGGRQVLYGRENKVTVSITSKLKCQLYQPVFTAISYGLDSVCHYHFFLSRCM